MAKLGTKKRPAIVHVETEMRAGEIMQMCQSHGWQVIVGIEPDKPEDISDVRKLIKFPRRVRLRRFAGRPRANVPGEMNMMTAELETIKTKAVTVLKCFDELVAVGLAGSQALGVADEFSDLDLQAFVVRVPPLDWRRGGSWGSSA